MTRKVKRRVGVRVLPGEPTDGSGRVCIHLFVQDIRGPITETHVLHSVIGEDGKPIKGKCEAKPTRGRLACDRNRRITTVRNKSGVIPVTVRSDDPRAVTCPKCIASSDYTALMEKLGVQR